jgi:hypothetical protein
MLNSGVRIVTVCELLQVSRISPFSVFEVLLTDDGTTLCYDFAVVRYLAFAEVFLLTIIRLLIERNLQRIADHLSNATDG